MLPALIRKQWGLGSRVLADVFIPGATAAERDEFVAFARDYLGVDIIFWSVSSPWLAK